jgi:hypothetical protein
MIGSAKRPAKSEIKRQSRISEISNLVRCEDRPICKFENGQKIGQKVGFSAENYVIITTYTYQGPAKNMTAESPQWIEPAQLEQSSEAITDLVAELASATLGHALNPRTAANLAGLVRIMNTYYSNLIEGHNTRQSEIERALAGNFEGDRQLPKSELWHTSAFRPRPYGRRECDARDMQ